jgi:3-oxoacyl-ACP reductase-like protein
VLSSTDTKIFSGRPLSVLPLVATASATVTTAAASASTTTAAVATAITATAATTTTTAAAEAATAAATTTTATGALLRDVNAQRASFEILLVQLVERLLGALGRRHLDEAETARLASHPVEHQLDLFDFTARGELLLDQVFSGVEGQVADVQTISHKFSRCVSH